MTTDTESFNGWFSFELHNEVGGMLANFAQDRTEHTQKLHQNLAADYKDVVGTVAEMLSNFTSQRIQETSELRSKLADDNASRVQEASELRSKLADDSTSRAKETSETLHQLYEQRVTMRQQLQEDLLEDHIQRINEIAEVLGSFAGIRADSGQTLKEFLKSDRTGRKEEVKQTLEKVQAELDAQTKEPRQQLSEGATIRHHTVEEFLKEQAQQQRKTAQEQTTIARMKPGSSGKPLKSRPLYARMKSGSVRPKSVND